MTFWKKINYKNSSVTIQGECLLTIETADQISSDEEENWLDFY